jgi:hypothetical protein
MQSNVNELIQYMSKVLTKQKHMTTNESMFVHKLELSPHSVGVYSQWTHGAFLLVSLQCQLRKDYLHSLFISSTTILTTSCCGGTTSKNRAKKLVESSDNVKVNRKGGNW